MQIYRYGKKMSDLLKFFQEQVLSMKFLNELIGQVLLKAGVDTSSKLGDAVQFFYMIQLKYLYY